MASKKTLRVLIVDDHEVVRAGLRSFLGRKQQLEVVGEAASVREALEQVANNRPDVVVMDVRLPDGSGADACRDIRASYPEVKVLILTSFPDTEAVVASITAGASGYLLKDTRGADLVKAIEAVGGFGSLLDATLVRGVIETLQAEINRKPRDAFGVLTDRETILLELIAQGKTNREIAQQVFLSEKTVKNYVSVILGKLHLTSRAQAAAYAASRRVRHIG